MTPYFTALRTQADKEGAANNVSRMYFVVLVMADVLKDLTIPSTANYTAELNSRTSDLAAAEQAEKLAKNCGRQSSLRCPAGTKGFGRCTNEMTADGARFHSQWRGCSIEGENSESSIIRSRPDLSVFSRGTGPFDRNVYLRCAHDEVY
jgi:hypothetical protein